MHPIKHITKNEFFVVVLVQVLFKTFKIKDIVPELYPLKSCVVSHNNIVPFTLFNENKENIRKKHIGSKIAINFVCISGI